MIGRRRARVHSSRDSPDGAGYRVASVTFDPPGAATAAAPAALAALALAADAAATRWAGRLTALGPAAWAELCGRAGERPPPTQPERLSWWLAAMLPVNGADTAALGAPGTAERLRRMVALVDGLEARRAQGAGPGGCEHM